MADFNDTNNDTHDNEEESDLDEAAAGDQLPYVAEQNATAERGEDHSDTTDPDERADEAGKGDVIGGINMH